MQMMCVSSSQLVVYLVRFGTTLHGDRVTRDSSTQAIQLQTFAYRIKLYCICWENTDNTLKIFVNKAPENVSFVIGFAAAGSWSISVAAVELILHAKFNGQSKSAS